MKPDITIYNATTSRSVIIGHSRAGQALLSEHYGVTGIHWICIERVSMAGTRKFQELHAKIVAAHLVVRNDQATERRLNELTEGQYAVFGPGSNTA